MRDKAIPDYTSFFSGEAIGLIRWSAIQRNRIKDRRIYEAACRVEYYYRKHKMGNTSPDFHRWIGRLPAFASSLWVIRSEALWREKNGYNQGS